MNNDVAYHPVTAREKTDCGRFLRRRIDLGPVFFTLSISVAQSLLFWAATPVMSIMLTPFLWIMQTRSIYIAHNHYHCAIFRPKALNRIFETLLFLQTGIPSFGFPLHHNIGHHGRYRNQHPNDPDADPHRWIGANGRRLGRWKYTFGLLTNAIAVGRRLGTRHPRLWRNFLVAAGCYAIGLAVLLAWHPIQAFAVFLIPMSLSLVALAWSTYVHHLGLPTDDPFGASYTNLGRWVNHWGYNIGYHTAHHIEPGRHWSELPELHGKIAARVPRHCYYNGGIAPYAREHWPLP